MIHIRIKCETGDSVYCYIRHLQLIKCCIAGQLYISYTCMYFHSLFKTMDVIFIIQLYRHTYKQHQRTCRIVETNNLKAEACLRCLKEYEDRRLRSYRGKIFVFPIREILLSLLTVPGKTQIQKEALYSFLQGVEFFT